LTHRQRISFGLVLAGLVLALDQASKAAVLDSAQLQNGAAIPVIPGVFDLVSTWNPGITFGLLRYGSAWVFLIPVALGVIGALLVWLIRSEYTTVSCAVGCILGGAVGNVVDRVRYGRVVDFLHLHLGTSEPFPYIFNVGDTAIVLGVFTLLADMAVSRGKPAHAVHPR